MARTVEPAVAGDWKAKEHDMISSELDSADVAKVFLSLGGGKDEDDQAAAESEWTVGDAVGKILVLIKQMSPQARDFFKKCCLQVGVPALKLLLWVRTHWASLYKCLDRALQLRKEPADVTQSFSSERTPTIWCIIPMLEFLIEQWETMATQPRFAEIEDVLSEVLDPNIKDCYFQERWSDEQFKKGMEGLDRVVHHFLSSTVHIMTPEIVRQISPSGGSGGTRARSGAPQYLYQINLPRFIAMAVHSCWMP
ncbi:hypothetical protein B0H14DRAFT_3136081 [Mycena olivaceomarginata]|nr:hypothetical protein B0H14DRAFT_3136081 [Mycena olivaceomarginata]